MSVAGKARWAALSPEVKQRRAEAARKRWQELPLEEKLANYRRSAATMMVVRPDIAIFPERWIAESMRGDA